jgi:tRNA dimethylallyltransferase
MPMKSIEQLVLVLVGPTAIGKTELSFSLAEYFNCEIISMDSVQVYRFMDIGSAKPGREERKRVRHHLIDIVDPDEQYSAASFVRDCLRAVENICNRGKTPLITGGTGLYLSCLINGLFETVHVKSEVREALKTDLRAKGLATLHQELATVDPLSAKRIHPNDRQRILRGLEIYRATGIPWSEHLRQQKERGPAVRFSRLYCIGLECERQLLYRRIDRRAEQMLDQGLVEEVTCLREMGYGPELASMQSIGYRHVNKYLDGDYDLTSMVSDLARDTRRYAKRQMTWFRRQACLNWYDRQEENSIIHDVKNFVKKDR